MRIAFYAPLKAPDHPVPSGDRAIARALLAALRRSGVARGWQVEVASRFRSFDGRGDAGRQARLRAVGMRLADRLVRRYRDGPADRRPVLWCTYHLHHKAPDWLGPAVSERLGIPYMVVEASHAAKQAGGAWSIGHEAAALAIRRAAAILALNRDDVPGLRPVVADASKIAVLPPFLGPRGVLADTGRYEPDPTGHGKSPDPSSRPEATPEPAGAPAAPGRFGVRAAVAHRFGVPGDEPWLLCVAMMRSGRKLASFEVLADALARPGLAAARWHLLIAGDGPARREVDAALARSLPAGRITLIGRVEGEALAALYASADLFVWPAVGEPMGMAMLEAQGHGLPVVAARTRGVTDLVRHRESGLLVPERDVDAFAEAVENLLAAPERRRRMGAAARSRVAREHSFEAASNRIGALVEMLLRVRPVGTGGALAPGPDSEAEAGKETEPKPKPEPVRPEAAKRKLAPTRAVAPMRAGGT